MEIKVRGNMIEINTSENAVFSMNWQEMRQLARAIKLIEEIIKITTMQSLDLIV